MSYIQRVAPRAGTVGAIEDTLSYQACVGKKIEGCSNQFPPDLPGNQWSAAQLAKLNDCIVKVQSDCRQQALNAAGALSSAQVKTLQSSINKALVQNGYQTIAVDGILGPNTCGAATWAASAGYAVVVPGACGNNITWAPVDAAGAPVTTTPAAKAPAPAPATSTPTSTTATTTSSGVPWGLILGGAAGLGALLLYAEAQKKKKHRSRAA